MTEPITQDKTVSPKLEVRRLRDELRALGVDESVIKKRAIQLYGRLRYRTDPGRFIKYSSQYYHANAKKIIALETFRRGKHGIAPILIQRKQRSNVSPVTQYAHRMVEEARLGGVSDAKSLHRVYKNAWMRASHHATRKERNLPIHVILTHAANAEAAAWNGGVGLSPKEQHNLGGAIFSRLIGRRKRRLHYIKPENKIERNALRRAQYQSKIIFERERSRQRRIKHPKYHNTYTLARIQNDPEFAMISRLRNLVKHRLGARRKDGHTIDILGCSPRFFGRWIESHFEKGMSWKNRKLWDLGHVFPSSACIKDEIALSFHYRNLKPQWKSDNIAARNKITSEGIVSAFVCGIRSIVVKTDWQITPELESRARAIGFTIIKPPTTDAN